MGDEQLARARAALVAGVELDDVAAEYTLSGKEIAELIEERIEHHNESDERKDHA